MSQSDDLQYGEIVRENAVMRYNESYIQSPSFTLFDPAAPHSNAVAVGQGGRQAAWFIEGAFGRAVLRHYRRGGMVARFSKDRYLWQGAEATRSMAEFRILSSMHAAGLAVPRPLAAAYWRSGLSYRAAIVIERIENSRTLTEMVHQSPLSAETTAQVAKAIFAMHEAGYWHADLNAYNILLDDHGKAWLIDFDKALEGDVSLQKREDNLIRLQRSLRKVASHKADLWWKGINDAYKSLQAA